ncbi:periplasmic binding protein-like II [Thozetella sp. PMI_491]|nr:periplasmic binding protein-like II [Thozetella sp. PMI_491]
MASAPDAALRVSLEKVDFRHPTQVTDDSSVLTLKNLISEPLLRWQPGGLVQAGLFDRWVHSSDGRRWCFFIREGAVFHDGKPCVAEDVTAFISAILESRDSFGMRWSYHRYLSRARITAMDTRAVTVENPEPLADILDIFTEFYVCRIALDGSPVLGTGRYRVSYFDREGGTAVLDHTAPAGAPLSPPRIIATAEPCARKRLEQLCHGVVDVALNLERAPGPLTYDPALQWKKTTTTLSVIYYLDCTSGPFSSPAARLAVNHALDAAELSQEVFHGLAVPASTVVSPFHLGGRRSAFPPIPYDPGEARRLLAVAGVDTSVPIVLRTPTTMPERAEEITEFVARSLEAVGLRVVVEVEEDRRQYARQVGLEKSIGDLALFDSSPNSTYRVLNDKISSTAKGVWWQGYEDAKAEEMITVANRAVESQERELAYSRCLKRLRDNPPWLYVVHPIVVMAARGGIEGVCIDHKGMLVVS